VADRASQLKPHWGIGAGVRYLTPVGPLQADLAWGVTTRKLRLHVSVGFEF
jgi:translocation and assembly module TamA